MKVCLNTYERTGHSFIQIFIVLASRIDLSEILPTNNTPTMKTRKAKLPCRLIRPYQQNTAFVGRKNIIAEIDAALNPKKHNRTQQSTFALTGLGGIGKTQTALAYVFKSWDLFHAILWVQADSHEKMLYSFADFAFELGLVDNNFSNQSTALQEVKRWFENVGKRNPDSCLDG